MASLQWIGKQAVVGHHRDVPYHLLKGDPALSVGQEGGVGSGNLLVQGDNLVALKALLPYYAGKVKCIYIDPPYNTGNEGWVYNDNVNSPEIRQWLGKVVGKEGETLDRHDRWLCMMYPRLALLREFLTEDGVICVSIDDEEVANLKLLMDELFSRRNFIAHVVWQKRYVSNVTAKFLSDMHDHILMYGKAAENVVVGRIARSAQQESDFKSHDDDPRGPWRAQDLSASKPYQAGQFTIKGPTGLSFQPPPGRYWRCSEEQYKKWLADDRITFGKAKTGRPMLKAFLSEVQSGLTPNTWWSHDFAGHNKEATLELKDLFGGESPFDTPKPVKLLSRILQLFAPGNSLVLDSFAGSGTTAHAVLNENAADGGARRFILVEQEASIAEKITAPRVSRVLSHTEDALTAPRDEAAPGFRYVKLGEPLFNERGQVRAEVRFADLAAHVFFTETGEPLPRKVNGKKSPLIGVCRGTAYYLLFNGVLGDKRPDGGNVLTGEVLAELPAHDGPRVVFGEACKLSAARLGREGVTFRQIPYQIKVS